MEHENTREKTNDKGTPREANGAKVVHIIKSKMEPAKEMKLEEKVMKLSEELKKVKDDFSEMFGKLTHQLGNVNQKLEELMLRDKRDSSLSSGSSTEKAISAASKLAVMPQCQGEINIEVDVEPEAVKKMYSEVEIAKEAPENPLYWLSQSEVDLVQQASQAMGTPPQFPAATRAAEGHRREVTQGGAATTSGGLQRRKPMKRISFHQAQKIQRLRESRGAANLLFIEDPQTANESDDNAMVFIQEEDYEEEEEGTARYATCPTIDVRYPVQRDDDFGDNNANHAAAVYSNFGDTIDQNFASYKSSTVSCDTIINEESVNTTWELTSIDLYAEEDNLLNISNAHDSNKAIQTFFSETERISKTLTVDKFDVRISALRSVLRPYQRATVEWMLMRECKREEIRLNEQNITLPAGGILADEMGLGKTVEMLACILSHQREKPPDTYNTYEVGLGKRKSSDKTSFPKKKPYSSPTEQNQTLKSKIGDLLEKYYPRFLTSRVYKKTERLNEKCKNLIEDGFKIILLNRFYKYTEDHYRAQQISDYLTSVYDVDRESSEGYSILQKEKNEPVSIMGPLSDEEADDIITCVDQYLNEKMIKNFAKDLNQTLPNILPNENVSCKCGSHSANGKKIECAKCGTLQHLTCVGLENRGPNANEDLYYCPHCWMDEPPIESSCTLIVVPTILAKQWEEEIIKHASGNLRVFCYGGVDKNYVLPPLLAAPDIVLVTIDVLRAEFSFITNETRTLRHTKQYRSFASPLTCINWWRLCIDEAQKVENANKVSEMASRIKCVHLWAVTGTPIVKSLNDLHGLTTYLRINPFTESSSTCWNSLLYDDQSSLHKLFAYIMRRKTIDEVWEQLDLPELAVETTWLSFPPTEGFFYYSTHAASQKTFLQKIKNIKKLDEPLMKANRRTVDGVLAPLLSLRQACVHPQAAKSVNLFNLRDYVTIEQLLEKMIKKTKVDCDDTLRSYIMLVNGAANVHGAVQNYRDAVTLYRSVLAKMNKEYDNLSVDDFQMIHIMHNLYQAALKDATIELTNEEKKFPQRIAELEKKCSQKNKEGVEAMKQQAAQHSNEINKTLEKFELKCFEWWQNMLKQINFNKLLGRIRAEFDVASIDQTPELQLKLSSVDCLTEALKQWLTDVEQKRGSTCEFLERINITRIEDLFVEAENCHIRKGEPKTSCLLCQMEKAMLKYADLLFNVSNKKKGDVKGNWIKRIFNVLLTSSRTHGFSASDSKNASAHLKVLDMLEKEYKSIQDVWKRQCDFLNVYDTISMAKRNFDVNAENAFQDVTDASAQHQLKTYKEKSEARYIQLQRKYGQLQYLKNVEKSYTNDEIKNACSVCHSSMDEKRWVMTCGHFTCYRCMQPLLEQGISSCEIRCPICQTLAPLLSITCVYGGGTTDYDTSAVKGNYSIKVLAITAKVLHLRQEDPKVKILIFSTWAFAFDVIEKAFDENQISFRKFGYGQDRKISLKYFKSKDDVNVLLIPLQSGSTGLNLTEASHIIFIEPVLYLADEKQAIGRICRLGQSKNMTVHKFLIKGTVEEPIYRMNDEAQRDFSKFELTFQHLRDLFETSS